MEEYVAWLEWVMGVRCCTVYWFLRVTCVYPLKAIFYHNLTHDHASKTPSLSLVPTAINSINIKASTLVSFT